MSVAISDNSAHSAWPWRRGAQGRRLVARLAERPDCVCELDLVPISARTLRLTNAQHVYQEEAHR
jgi:hypothetical protein